jgi:hypothetical protein
MKIYLLSKGQYSDRRVIGVFDNIKDYKEAERLSGYCNPVKEMELNAMPCDRPEGLYPFSVVMEKDGKVFDIEKSSYEYLEKENSIGWDVYTSDDTNFAVSFHMWARDEDHAIKIASDRRAMLLANDQWISDISTWYNEEEKGNLINFL